MPLWKIHVTSNNSNYTYQFLTEIIPQLICTFSHFTYKGTLKQNNVRSLIDFFRLTIWLNK